MVKPGVRRLVLEELAYQCFKEYGDKYWSSISSTGLYLRGCKKDGPIIKVGISDSANLATTGLVSLESILGDEEDSPLEVGERASIGLLVVQENGNLIAYECDIDLLGHVAEKFGSWLHLGVPEKPLFVALPQRILKEISSRSFTFKSELFDQLVAKSARRNLA
jgi:hypothetical protein